MYEAFHNHIMMMKLIIFFIIIISCCVAFNRKSYFKVSFPTFVDRLGKHKIRKEDQRHGNIGLNNMVWDIGIPVKYSDRLDVVVPAIRAIDARFGLVMIKERMEESLVLLADLLCWPLESMAGFTLNERENGRKAKLTQNQRKILQSFQRSDEIFYRHFRAEFNRRVEDFGRERMEIRMAELRRLNAKWGQKCRPEGEKDAASAANAAKVEEEGVLFRYGTEYSERKSECELMTLNEPELINFVREMQFAKWKNFTPGENDEDGRR